MRGELHHERRTAHAPALHAHSAVAQAGEYLRLGAAGGSAGPACNFVTWCPQHFARHLHHDELIRPDLLIGSAATAAATGAARGVNRRGRARPRARWRCGSARTLKTTRRERARFLRAASTAGCGGSKRRYRQTKTGIVLLVMTRRASPPRSALATPSAHVTP